MILFTQFLVKIITAFIPFFHGPHRTTFRQITVVVYKMQPANQPINEKNTISI